MFASPFPDVDIPEASVFDFLFADLDEAALDHVALIDTADGAQTTYRELIERVNATAGALAARGIGVGDVVGLLAPNSSRFAVAFHGILRAGATATTINALFTAHDIAKQLTDANATMLITVSALLPQAQEAARTVGITPENLVVLDGGGAAATGHPNTDDLLAPGAPAPQVDFDPARHLAVLPYSSGTTANPKGVMLTHRNLVANMAQIRPLLAMRPDDTILAVLPFFHIYGMTVLLNAALQARATLVVMPRFELAEFLNTIQNHRITYGFIAPPVAVALAKHPLVDQYDTSSLRVVLSGAAPLDAELGAAVAERLTVRVLQGYGMSELSPVSHVMPADGGQEHFGEVAPLSSCGWPVPNTTNKIVDPATGKEVAYPAQGLSEPGELWVRGPNVMAGYLGNEEATTATIDSDGFLHTGDLAQIDDAGRVFIVDRLKELIKYKGYQVPPAELEALLLTHPAITDAAVIGITDDEGEEIPKAFVVRRPGTDLTGDEVIEFVARRVAPYKKVRRVEFVGAIPKSASGKILRKDLRSPTA
ncbi:4-coumarate--CoA ligase family protein [Streptomyces griseorubiginosus]|uniref:4-coumarate--CoA ligase family protein n=1 Tax=Streptomyces griseorubiginosus TaxID=67304 RepID=UPI00076CBFC9|nr:4-coumarate--CoA ligase family protein [Streptomyces griseorubiginosus]KUM68117.1 AMP-dependent synthetase [Streptomyces griseorubiginosus]